jgi:hypothetical protein
MSRISSQSFKVNSDLEQLVSITNTSLPVSVAGTLAVSDSIAQADLSSINTALGGTLQVSDSVAQTDLQAINTALGGTLQVSDSVAQADLSTLSSTVSGGRVLVTTGGSAANSGSNGNLDSASVKAAGDFSSEIDTTSSQNLSIFGISTNTTDAIEVHVSANTGADFVKWGYEIYPDSSGNFSQNFSNVAFNYVKIKYVGSGTVTATLLHN